MFDHSNCGIGAIANLDGTYSHSIIEQGMTLFKSSKSPRWDIKRWNRGWMWNFTANSKVIFIKKKYSINEPFAVMMTFLPKEIENRNVAIEKIYEATRHFGIKLIKEIEVPVNSSFLTPTAKSTEPVPTQFIF